MISGSRLRLIIGGITFVTLTLAALGLGATDLNSSFYLGFILALLFASLSLILSIAWKGNPAHSAAAESNVRSHNSAAALVAATAIISLAVLASGYWINERDSRAKELAKDERIRRVMESEKTEALRIKNLAPLLTRLLDDIENELANRTDRNLSDELIQRIAGFSQSLKAYTLFEGDSLSEIRISPERGQLLQYIVTLKIDSISLEKVMARSTFAHADLRRADLSNTYLAGIDLQEALLQESNLTGTNLAGANLTRSNLRGATLHDCVLTKAQLTYSDGSWTDFSRSILNEANLNESSLTAAKFISASLAKAKLMGSRAEGALFTNANLAGTYFQRSQLAKASFEGCDLTDANLSWIALTDVNMLNTKLEGVTVSYDNWIELLDRWLVSGAGEIQSRYHVVDESPDVKDHFVIRSKNN